MQYVTHHGGVRVPIWRTCIHMLINLGLGGGCTNRWWKPENLSRWRFLSPSRVDCFRPDRGFPNLGTCKLRTRRRFEGMVLSTLRRMLTFYLHNFLRRITRGATAKYLRFSKKFLRLKCNFYINPQIGFSLEACTKWNRIIWKNTFRKVHDKISTDSKFIRCTMTISHLTSSVWQKRQD